MNYKLRQTGQEVQDILDNAAIQHPIHTIESFVPTVKLANGVYCTEANTIVVVQGNGNKATTIDPVNGTRYYQWQDSELPDSGEYTMLVQGFQPFFPTANTITLTLPLAVDKNTSAILQAATALTAGLMSAQDKGKLDSLKDAGIIAVDSIALNEIHEAGAYYGKREKALCMFYGGGNTTSLGIYISASTSITFLKWDDELNYYSPIPFGEYRIDALPNKVELTAATSPIDTYTTSIEAATSTTAGVMSAADKAKLDGIEAGAQVNNIKSVESIDDFFALDPYTLESGVWVCQGDYSLICVSELQGQGMPWMRFASFFDIDNCVVKTAMAIGGSSSMEWSKTDGTYWRTVKNYENVIETIKVNGTTLQVSNKAVDIVLNTATSTDMVNLWNNL